MVEVKLTHSQMGSTTWSPHDHADLKLPTGLTIAQTSTEELRRELHRLGIERAHTRPRLEIIRDYAATLNRIGREGASAAIDAWLQQHRVA